MVVVVAAPPDEERRKPLPSKHLWHLPNPLSGNRTRVHKTAHVLMSPSTLLTSGGSTWVKTGWGETNPHVAATNGARWGDTWWIRSWWNVVTRACHSCSRTW